MPTTTTLNTRLFAPHVILAQDTTRIAIKIKANEGYTVPSGLTLGDVIRYDPSAGYTLSRANTESNAEVLGVIESISSGEHTVVCSGSIKYPPSRLAVINSGGGGGIDVLFLDENVAGGLTGTIDLASGSEKIVKPVMQIAPHAGYNGVVVNYVGYKTGNQAVSQEDAPLLPVGSIMYSLPSTTPGVNWIRIDTETRINATDYAELYSLYGKNYGLWLEKIQVNSGTIFSDLVGQSLYKSTDLVIPHGTITEVDIANDVIYVLVAAGIDNFPYTTTTGVIDGETYSFSSSSVYEFTIPAVSSASPITQGSTTLVPFIKAYESVSIKIPEVITLTGITATNNIYVGGNATVVGTLTVGGFADVAGQIQAIKTFISMP